MVIDNPIHVFFACFIKFYKALVLPGKIRCSGSVNLYFQRNIDFTYKRILWIYITLVNGLSGPFLDKINLLLKELFTCIEIIGKYSKFKDCSLINNTLWDISRWTVYLLLSKWPVRRCIIYTF